MLKRKKFYKYVKTLKNHDDLTFNMISDLTAVDNMKEMNPGELRFHVVYQLFSTITKKRIRLKAAVGGEYPEIESVTGIWCGSELV